MPRRNRPKTRTNRARPTRTRTETNGSRRDPYHQMARSLVRRGLASPRILGYSQRIRTDAITQTTAADSRG